MRAVALPKQNKRKTDLRKTVGRFFMRVSLPMGGPAGAVAKPRGRPEAVTARSAALRGLILGLQGVKKVVQMPICPLLSPFLLRETVLY